MKRAIDWYKITWNSFKNKSTAIFQTNRNI